MSRCARSVSHVVTLALLGVCAACGDGTDGGGGPSRGPGAEEVGEARVFRSASEEALAWLAARQAGNGGWSEDASAVPVATDDPGLTGLVLTAFLGMGYTNRGSHPHARVVAAGLLFLRQHQAEDGRFRPAHRPGDLRDHVFAAQAMVEACSMTGSPILRANATSALAAIQEACEAGDAGLRDTEVAARALATLLSARLADDEARRRGRPVPFGVDVARFASLRRWLEPPDVASGGRHALALLAHLVFRGNEHEGAAESLAILAAPVTRLPLAWTTASIFGGPGDWAVLNAALEGVREGEAVAWQRAARRVVRERQCATSTVETTRGSWDPASLPGCDVGRIRLTACCLGVLHYHCYDRLRVGPPR